MSKKGSMNREINQQKIADLIDGTSECARDILQNGDLGRQVERMTVKAEETIREHPVKSAVAGLVSGFIIGKIIS